MMKTGYSFLMKLDKEEERLQRELEVLRRHVKNVEELVQSIRKTRRKL
ncbi:MAG: hypothetical protein GTN64_05885 [Candidatus Latescibacteria bacterium]|nr:hypothetical protein [Candidatus Latescibacterota bacterium]NIO78138.1 hypothetical protein [Candidatus Latescibacterota bacterium]